jgi:hypothetical protein
VGFDEGTLGACEHDAYLRTPDGQIREQTDARSGARKRGVLLVVDGAAAQLAYTTEGTRGVLSHTGTSGTSPADDISRELELASEAVRTFWVRWAHGKEVDMVDGQGQTRGQAMGWWTRRGPEAASLVEVTRRPGAVMAFVSEAFGLEAFGTTGCSMGTVATFSPVLWHGLADRVDYQLLVGGPAVWDVDVGCRLATYEGSGWCADDGASCDAAGDCGDAACLRPEGMGDPIQPLYNTYFNHLHVSTNCGADGALPGTFESSSMARAVGARWSSKRPLPAPMAGTAIEAKPCRAASATALRIDCRMLISVAVQSMLIPATWMMALCGSRPAPVTTALPRGIAPCFATSRNGAVPARRLIAPETPCGMSSHHGMMLRFQALTMASTG